MSEPTIFDLRDITVDDPTPNLPLLRKTVDWARAENEKALRREPSEWMQSDWRTDTDCGSAFCIAGKIADDDPDVEWEIDAYDGWLLRASSDSSTSRWAFYPPDVGEYACIRLGLDRTEAADLFAMFNGIEDVVKIAERIAERAGERL